VEDGGIEGKDQRKQIYDEFLSLAEKGKGKQINYGL